MGLPERERPLPPERERLRDEPLPPLRLRDEALLLRRRLLDPLRRRLPPLRSLAGIDSRTMALVSVGICFCRNDAMRSSSRRIERASLAVSLSPTCSARVSIAL